MLRKIVRFDQAEKYLAARRDKPTYLKAAEYLTAWDAETRRRSFFSARVASADILAELHQRCQQVVDGKMTQAQAREWLRMFLETDGRDALSMLGFLPQPDAPDAVAELASVRRLRLILYQNTKIAHEVGQYRQWAETRDIFPYGRWRLGPSKEHRTDHAARNGRVYAFDHPIWRESPPGSEFNCKCYRELVTAEEAAGLTIQPNTSAFEKGLVDFDPAGGLAVPPPIKVTVPEGIVDAMRAHGYVRNDMPDGELRTRIDDAMATVRRTFSVGLPDTQVRPMTDEEEEADSAQQGLAYFDRTAKTLRIGIRQGNEFPGVVAVHEAVHGLFLAGRLTTAQEAKVFQAVQKTGTYATFDYQVRTDYGQRTDHEWVVRAMTWYALMHGAVRTLKSERVAFLKAQAYCKHRWSTREKGLGDMEKAIASLRPGLLSRLARRLGMADNTDDSHDYADMPSPSAPGLTDEERDARAIAIAMTIPDEEHRKGMIANIRMSRELGREPCGTF